MKNNEFEYFTYEVDMPGIIDVYGWDRYSPGHECSGHPRKVFMKTYTDLREVLSEYPGIYDSHPAFE
jgi:hypothetical protein